MEDVFWWYSKGKPAHWDLKFQLLPLALRMQRLHEFEHSRPRLQSSYHWLTKIRYTVLLRPACWAPEPHPDPRGKQLPNAMGLVIHGHWLAGLSDDSWIVGLSRSWDVKGRRPCTLECLWVAFWKSLSCLQAENLERHYQLYYRYEAKDNQTGTMWARWAPSSTGSEGPMIAVESRNWGDLDGAWRYCKKCHFI